jgi:hypothetical protein
MRTPLVLAMVVMTSRARADELVRRPDATLGQMFAGPFHTSRLFSMPTADVIGAYIMSFSGDGSLLQQPGVLTSAGVLAIGFGDIAQLEYRHPAISVTVNAPVPAVGVQLQIPMPIALIGVRRRGSDRRTAHEQFGAPAEKVTDFYLVTRRRCRGCAAAGVRVSPAAQPHPSRPFSQAPLALPAIG